MKSMVYNHPVHAFTITTTTSSTQKRRTRANCVPYISLYNYQRNDAVNWNVFVLFWVFDRSFCESERESDREGRIYRARSCSQPTTIWKLTSQNVSYKVIHTDARLNVFVHQLCAKHTTQWLFTRFHCVRITTVCRFARSLTRARSLALSLKYSHLDFLICISVRHGANLTEPNGDECLCESCARMLFKCPKSSKHKPHNGHTRVYNKNKHAPDKTDQRINNNTAETYIRSDFCTTSGANY